jgi:hypothetical protein
VTTGIKVVPERINGNGGQEGFSSTIGRTDRLAPTRPDGAEHQRHLRNVLAG